MKYLLLLLTILSLGANYIQPQRGQWEAYGREFSHIHEQCTLLCICNPCICPGCQDCCYYFFSYSTDPGLRPYDSPSYRRYFSARWKHYDTGRILSNEIK